MTAKVIMVQGTASSVGKSILVTALCRIFKQDGHRVAPFKSQNMALNSFVTREGGEIGRAQAVQAEACGIEPSIYMNPVLLKPEADQRSQVIVEGKVARNLKASQYGDYAVYLLNIVENDLNKLRSQYEIVVIEGAGAAAEVNLKDREIVNMRIAKMAKAPVLLVGDIDRGGVFASMVGTLELLTEEERGLVKGLIINKFRGEKELFSSGVEFLEMKTGKPVLGVIPFLKDLAIAQEDSVYLDDRPKTSGQGLNVAVIRLPHIANYDDFDPLQEMGCNVQFINRIEELGRPDLLVLPGTKSTINDLNYLKETNISKAVQELASQGVPVIGICGGFQMLGRTIRDPEHAESTCDEIEGLGLLPIETLFTSVKDTVQAKACITGNQGLLKGLEGCQVSGYEIHMGQTTKPEAAPLARIFETALGKQEYFDGAVNEIGLVFGTYLHGIFHNADFTDGLLRNLWKLKGQTPRIRLLKSRQDEYDRLADVVRLNIDMKLLYKILGTGP
jgi:adenosylcobyric acid synthase